MSSTQAPSYEHLPSSGSPLISTVSPAPWSLLQKSQGAPPISPMPFMASVPGPNSSFAAFCPFSGTYVFSIPLPGCSPFQSAVLLPGFLPNERELPPQTLAFLLLFTEKSLFLLVPRSMTDPRIARRTATLSSRLVFFKPPVIAPNSCFPCLTSVGLSLVSFNLFYHSPFFAFSPSF